MTTLRNILSQFSVTNSFSATAQFTINDTNGQELLSFKHPMSYSEGKLRYEIDIRTMKANGISADADEIAEYQKKGTDRVGIIYRPDRNRVYMLYPTLKACCGFTYSTNSPSSFTPTIEQAAGGTDTVDGHSCAKYPMSWKFGGREWKGMVWRATDLGNFPIRVDFGRTHLEFTNIRMERPSNTVFELPADCAMSECLDNNSAENERATSSK